MTPNTTGEPTGTDKHIGMTCFAHSTLTFTPPNR